jgi:phosphohistidine phosphatase
MKQLLIIRHAKSSWNNSLMTDFERPLNDRGNRDAPEMAKRIIDKGIKIDTIVSSMANRALSTAEYFAKAAGIKKADIDTTNKLYHAPAYVFYDVINSFMDSDQTVAIFAHNPGITDFVNSLTKTKIDDMPTCGIYAVKIAIESWAEFKNGDKQFWFFDAPKL